jgi:acylphosphatase
VQGVGFRYTAQHLARSHPAVKGYVRNLPDGRVQMVVEGPDKDVDALLGSLKHHMKGNIQRADVSKSKASGEFADFSIRH